MNKVYCSLLEFPIVVDYICKPSFKEDIPENGSSINQMLANYSHMKPAIGGLWSSPFLEDGDFFSDWHRFVSKAGFFKKGRVLTTFNLKEGYNVLVVDDYDSLIEFCNRYLRGVDDIEKYLADSFSTPSFDFWKSYVDWRAICQELDAIYIDSSMTIFPFLRYLDVDTLYVINKDVIDPDSLVSYELIKGELVLIK